MQFPDPVVRLDYIEEPSLVFNHGQRIENPKDGLFLFGPMNMSASSRPVRVGVIGTERGNQLLWGFIDEISGPIQVPERGPKDKEHRLHLTMFPGISEAVGLHIDRDQSPGYIIPDKALIRSTTILNHHEAVARTVDLYVQIIERHLENEEAPVDVWAIVVPEIVFDRCRPESRRSGISLQLGDFHKKQRRPSNLPLLVDVLDLSDERIFEDIADFHRQLKARLLKIGATSQVLRETTLAPDAFLNAAGYPIRRTQDRATLAWNFASSLFYKTQPEPPWKMLSARSGVCYVGLAFKVMPNHPQEHACCAAQMFLSEGDGVVFRGAVGPWKSNERDFHLSKSEARRLIEMVIRTYEERHGRPPKELFIHSQARFNDDEWDGFIEGAPGDTNVVTVRIRPTSGDVKLFRDGDYPCLRGTAMVLDDRNAYLWSSGYTPGIDTYVGPETPNPLYVTLFGNKGEMPELRVVLQDILGLTKINYNACHYNDGIPVTIRFADKIGGILTMKSAEGAKKMPFKYYI